MKIVIDSNRLIAAMIKESTTREILLDQEFEFIAPDHLISEVRKYKDRITKASGISESEFEILLTLVLERITIIPESEYNGFIEKLKDEIKDQKDLPYLACCVATNAIGNTSKYSKKLKYLLTKIC